MTSLTRAFCCLVLLCYSMQLVFAEGEEAAAKVITDLRIGVTNRVKCEESEKTRNGDKLSMHYTGSLYDTKEKFDSSLDRGDPLQFTLGSGQVIKGWDRGLLGMCIGEKRRLVIPSEMGYGSRGSPPKIPANAALVFEVELVDYTRDKEL